MSQERRILRIDVTDPAEPRLIGIQNEPAPFSARKRHPRPGETWKHPSWPVPYRVSDVLPANEWHEPLVIVNNTAGHLALPLDYFLGLYTFQANP